LVTLMISPSKSSPTRSLHEFDLLPLHQFAFGLVGAAFGLAGFFGDIVQFLDRNGTALGLNGPRDGRSGRAAWTTAKHL
jgi:hypothetical protein